MHSISHLVISIAAIARLGIAIPLLDYALDIYYPWQVNEVIKSGKIKIEDCFITVPVGLGLGVELEREQLQKLHELFLACAFKNRTTKSK